MSNEIEWRDIPGYEGLYQVSNTGLIKGMVSSRGHASGRITQGAGRRYAQVFLTRNSQGQHHYVQRLVMLAFVGERPEGMQVNHINGNGFDNRLENLEYVTPSQNVRHRFDVLGQKNPRGEEVRSSKLTEEKVREIRRLYAQGKPTNELAPMYGVDISNIRLIVRRKAWTHVE